MEEGHHWSSDGRSSSDYSSECDSDDKSSGEDHEDNCQLRSPARHLQIQCGRCQPMFDTPELLNDHRKVHHPEVTRGNKKMKTMHADACRSRAKDGEGPSMEPSELNLFYDPLRLTLAPPPAPTPPPSPPPSPTPPPSPEMKSGGFGKFSASK